MCPPIFKFLAHLYKCSGRAVALPPVSVGIGSCVKWGGGGGGGGVRYQNVLSFKFQFFLCEGQGVDGAMLYTDIPQGYKMFFILN